MMMSSTTRRLEIYELEILELSEKFKINSTIYKKHFVITIKPKIQGDHRSVQKFSRYKHERQQHKTRTTYTHDIRS